MTKRIGMYENTPVTIIDPDEIPNEHVTEAETKTDEIAAALRDDKEAFLNVSRQTLGGNSPMEFVARIPADKYDYGQLQDYLQRTYGGGDYRVMLYAKGRLRENKLISIARAVSSAESTGDATLTAVMAQMERLNNQMITLMRDKNNGGQSRMDMLQEMMLFKQLFDAPKPASGIKDLIETLGALKELGLGGSDNESSGFDRLLSMAAPLVTQAFQTVPQPQRVSQQPQRVAQQHRMPNPAPLTRVNPQQNDEGNEMQLLVKMGINQLIKRAARGDDPGDSVEFIMDNLDEVQIKQFFNDPDGFNKLIAINTEISQHLQWFKTLAEHLKYNIGLPCDPNVSALYDDEESPIVDETLSSHGDGKNNLHSASDS